jgi:hypothetical protein
LVLVLIVSILLARTLGLFPGAPIFFVVSYVVVAEIAVPAGEFGPRLLVAVAAASLVWLLTMSDWLLRRVAGRRDPPHVQEPAARRARAFAGRRRPAGLAERG